MMAARSLLPVSTTAALAGTIGLAQFSTSEIGRCSANHPVDGFYRHHRWETYPHSMIADNPKVFWRNRRQPRNGVQYDCKRPLQS